MIVTYARRPELLRELGIVHDQILYSALIAVAVGGLVGLLVAMLIAARLRRIGLAAARIEAGAFDEPLESSFDDEVGALARTIDQMRERLRDSFGRLGGERDRLRQLLEGLHDGVVAVDGELRIAFANQAARTLLPGNALPAEEPLPDVWPDFPLRTFAAQLFGGGDHLVQARVIDHGRTFSLIGVPARAGADAILVLTDISERERRERAEREFVANAAHELGTPLTAIATSLEVLRAGAKNDPAERDRFLELIERQTSRLGRLRRALLTLARAQTRQEALQLEPVTAAAAARGRRGGAPAAGLGAEVTVEAPDDLAVLGHPELLEQVVLNLAENALRHGSATRVELVARTLDGRLAAIEVPGRRRRHPRRRPRPALRPLLPRLRRTGTAPASASGSRSSARRCARSAASSRSTRPRRAARPSGSPSRRRRFASHEPADPPRRRRAGHRHAGQLRAARRRLRGGRRDRRRAGARRRRARATTTS